MISILISLEGSACPYVISKQTYIKKTPFPNPDKLSIFPNPYGNLSLGGHLLEMAANNPTPNAKQSKNICILSLRSPRESVK
jgi:hypothetical protein